MARQLSFDLPVEVATGAEDFFVSAANAGAVAMIADDGAWPAGRLALAGPAGSGKTHLARIWAGRSGARVVPVAELQDGLPPAGARIAVDDADRMAAGAETALFHLCNHLAATGGRLLLTGRAAPARWPVALPDLASRLQATAVAAIGDPDDALLAAVIAKLFADRQISPAPDVVPYLARRIERSLAAAGSIVAEIDSLALAEGRAVNRSLARLALDRFAAGGG